MMSRGRIGVVASMTTIPYHGPPQPARRRRPCSHRNGTRARRPGVKLEVVRVVDAEGRVGHPEREPVLPGEEHRRIFRTMLLVRLLDERMLRLQRQGRLGFYLTSTGEEATHIGAAAALRTSDWIYPAYREIGAALYRGYPLRTFMCQLFGNAEDPIKGRQMPVHHSVRKLNF